MQTASPDPAHDARGSTVFADHTTIHYNNLSFDEEIALRQSFVNYLYGSHGGGPEHGSHEESDDPRTENTNEQWHFRQHLTG